MPLAQAQPMWDNGTGGTQPQTPPPFGTGFNDFVTASSRRLFGSSERNKNVEVKDSRTYCPCEVFTNAVLAIHCIYWAVRYFMEVIRLKALEEEYVKTDDNYQYDAPHDTNTTNLTLMIIGYVVYLYSSFSCSTSNYLLAKIDAIDLDGYMKNMKEKRMDIGFRCTFSHKERHTTGSGKNRKTTTRTVVTYREHQTFDYGSCVDKGPKRLIYPGYNVIRVDR